MEDPHPPPQLPKAPHCPGLLSSKTRATCRSPQGVAIMKSNIAPTHIHTSLLKWAQRRLGKNKPYLESTG